jgi:hypothetical protein
MLAPRTCQRHVAAYHQGETMRKMIMMALAGLIWKQFQTKVLKRPPVPKRTWRY